MLVLSRQRDQTITVGDTIRVIVVDIRGDKVRLGIDAPAEYAVYRKELYDGMVREIRAGGLPPRPRGKKQGHGILVLSRQRDETLVICSCPPYPLLKADEKDPALLEEYNKAVEHAKTEFLDVVAEVTVVDIRGDKVRIGTNAARVIGVHRQEVYDAIKTEGAKKKPEEAPAEQQK